ncbi:hypothetical protein [Lacihabitans sp. CS3-21]|uniref:hypothetical protein n=1 Tax=Lacihabitans sp. CS3-21 TaxID=2487332 RepID=UPI0020CD49DA|nr:hypothetical protein [Lacihabitans sp. CS3-21]
MKPSKFTSKKLNSSKKYRKTALQKVSGSLIHFFSLVLVFILFSISTFAQPASAMLDVSAPNKGVLIPRVSLTSNLDIATVPLPVTSLLVYNTSTSGTYPNNVSPNFYYWAGNKWKPLGGPLGYSEFFALMPGDNAATIAAGTAINFPQNGLTDGYITRSSSNQFILPDVGIYLVHWQVSISEGAQLVIMLNGTELANSVVGRATGTSQIVGHTLINTTLPTSILSITSPAGNTPALTITPTAGGTHAVSANLVITRIQ